MMMNKIMALDVGTKRIGVALSDYFHIASRGVIALSRKPEDTAINEIVKLAIENKVSLIVVGLPLNMDGTRGSQAEDCVKFAQKIPSFQVTFEDERLTSEAAEENLRNKKIDFRKDKGLVDIESACIILEQYMSRENTKN